MMSLADKIGARGTNNLNAIRLTLALGVIFSHSFALSYGTSSEAKGDPLMTWSHQQDSMGALAVDLFFFISGLLITASWLRSKSMQDYLMKRVLRIYPGYIAAVLFTGAVIWACCPDFRAKAVHGSGWWAAMAEDCVRLGLKSLNWDGVFASNPYAGVANGSLWTIPVEFSCYLLVLWAGLFCLFKRRWWILAVTLAIFAYTSGCLYFGKDITHKDYRFWTYFFEGASIWLWRDKIPFSGWLAALCAVVLVCAAQFGHCFGMLFPIAGGYLTLWVAYGPKINFMDWTNRTDLSYGTYLYAFPVQQMIAMHSSLRVPWMNFVIAVPIVLLLALLSWTLVEKRFLKLKSGVFRDYDPALAAPDKSEEKAAVEGATLAGV